MKYHHLTHIDIPEHYQFITFRTAKSTTNFLSKLYHQDKDPSLKQQDIDNYLDDSVMGSSLNGDVLIYLNGFLKELDGQLYLLIAFAIMPNHIHLLLKPLVPLTLMMQKIKGISAYKINKLLTQSGNFWDNSYYDKIIRDQKHFDLVYNYIKNNPLKLNHNYEQNKRFFGIYE